MPQETRENIEQYYDELSSSYDKSHTRGYFESINRFELSLLEKAVYNKRVLEVGCGTGILLERVAKKASAAIGIDLSSEMLKKAGERNLAISKADALKLPFKNNFFDVVYSVKVLPHIPKLESVFVEMSRVTKENGLVFFEFYNSQSSKNMVKAIFPTKTFTRYYSINRIKKMLPSNLELVEVNGLMVFTPSCVLYSVPLLGRVLDFLENAASRTFLKKLASHIVFVCRKKSSKVV